MSDSFARQRRALLELVQLDKSLGRALPTILEADARALEVERVSFWRIADDRSRITCERLFQLSTGALSSKGELLAADFPAYFKALLDDRVIDAPDALTDPRTVEFTERYFRVHGICALLDVPVWTRGALVGVVCHEHVGDQPRHWTAHEVDFALSVGGMVATALEAHARQLAEARYELLSTALQDLVWDWDLPTDHITWNDSIQRLRFAPGEVRPNLQWWKDHVHPDDLSRVMDGLTRHAANGAGVWRDEYRFRRGDGTWAIIVDRGLLQRSADGTPLRMVGAMVDVTEQRLLEARVTLTDRMASVGTMAAGVAHEINNPLTYVASNLRYAQRLLAGSGGNEVLQALDDALQGVERVREIVRDLKTFSRTETASNSAIEVRPVIESALSMARNELLHRAQLRVEHGDVPPVQGNAARLGQVLVNVLLNAAHAIPDGRAEENEVLVRSSRLANGRVAIEVSDSGIGVPTELLSRIFDPFFTTKPVGEGTGLGLAICHSMISAMGGAVTLENNPERGATARIELEAATQAEPSGLSPPETPPVPSRVRRARVLIIDDVPNVGMSLQRLLSDEHDAQCTTQAREALEAMRRGERWGVILCDLMMPELNGMEFVAELQRVAPELVRRVVIMTGGAFTPRAREFLASWPHQTVEKPCDPDRLSRVISRVINQG